MRFCPMETIRMGNRVQRYVSRVIAELGIIEKLSEYDPVLCGTYPLDLIIEGSDADIIMHASNLDGLSARIKECFGGQKDFVIVRRHIRGNEVLKANFVYKGIAFELFGQDVPSYRQHAYLHMQIEHALLQSRPGLRKQVMALRKQGMKTEPAFCIVLEIAGDPYEGLLAYGKEHGLISENIE